MHIIAPACAVFWLTALLMGIMAAVPPLGSAVEALGSGNAVGRIGSGLATLQLVAKAPPPPPYVYPPGGACSDVAICFGVPTADHAVLQRAPNRAAVYGSIPASYHPAPIAAVVTLSVRQFDGDGTKNYTATVSAERTWKVVLDARPAGGNYTLTIQCTAGCTTPAGAPASATAVDVTFGTPSALLCVFCLAALAERY